MIRKGSKIIVRARQTLQPERARIKTNVLHNIEPYIDCSGAALNRISAFAGGHTAWSRAWLVCLRARLFQGKEALDSLRGVISEQSVGSLYSLHPPLVRSPKKELADCSTCYELEDNGGKPR